MAMSGSVIPRSPWKELLRRTGRLRARPWMLSCEARCFSTEERTRPRHLPSPHRNGAEKNYMWMYENVGELIRTIDSRTLSGPTERVKLVDSEPECLCSWNPASGARQAIQVPGDASRPRTASAPLTDSTIHDSVDSPMCEPPSRVAGSVVVLRRQSWDNPLASLYDMKPTLKLDDVDLMMYDNALFYLLAVALGRLGQTFGGTKSGFALDISLINDTLVIQRRSYFSPSHQRALSTKLLKDCYEAATIPVPGIKNNTNHYQLLRYNIGSLTCVVSVSVAGTVQELPPAKEPSRPQKTRDVHGIDVITAGQGVLTPLAFQVALRPPKIDPRSGLKREPSRLGEWVPRLWMCGQTKLGVADLIPPGQDEGPGGLTVVELGERVMDFEENYQEGLQQLVRLLKMLRDTVRAHGGPCVVVFHKPKGRPLPNYHTIQVYSAGPEEMPVLLDWHKEHFWSKKHSPAENFEPQEKAQTKKSLIGQLAGWLGF